jgi:hypothetical protein
MFNKNQQMEKEKVTGRVLLDVEELDHRIAPGLTDLDGLIGTILPTGSAECPPKDDGGTEGDQQGGNNGYGNGGHDGVPGKSADNDSPNADEKAADQVR